MAAASVMGIRGEHRCAGLHGAPCGHRSIGFGGLCGRHYRQRVRERALADAERELRGLRLVPMPEEERREAGEEPERYEDPDGTPWEPLAG